VLQLALTPSLKEVVTMGPHRLRNTTLVAALATALALAAAATSPGRTGAGPTNTVDPSISGVAIVGRTLDGNRGQWSGAGITYAYGWLRCKASAGDDSSTASCTAIAGATKTTYKLASADLGFRIRFRVTGSTKGGNTMATSAATSVVTTESGAPASSSAPTISGSPLVGSTLSGSTGSWVGDEPITYSYRWLRCDSAGNACKEISGKTTSSYKVVQADVGKTLRLRVIAKNSRGQSDAFSNATDVVKDSGGGQGIITLPNGEKSVDVKDVPKGERLIVDTVQFDPNPVRSRTSPITVRIKVEDTRNYVVRGAYVFFRSTPILSSTPTDAQTATDGWITYSIQPRSDFPLRTGYSVQFFVKAYRKGDPTLAGIAGSRLVQVATTTP
jgi:hypothetical protein